MADREEDSGAGEGGSGGGSESRKRPLEEDDGGHEHQKHKRHKHRHSSTKKHKKKHSSSSSSSKKKKSKSKSKKHGSSSSSSGDDGSDGDIEWVESSPAPPTQAPPAPARPTPSANRDEWMTMRTVRPRSEHDEQPPSSSSTQQESPQDKIASRAASLELNPLLRHGRDTAAAAEAESQLATEAKTVGDGGASWRRRQELRKHQIARETASSSSSSSSTSSTQRNAAYSSRRDDNDDDRTRGRRRGNDDDDDDDDDDRPPPTQEEIRRLHAQAMKAQLRGDVDQHRELSRQIKAAEQQVQRAAKRAEQQAAVVRVSGLDELGRSLLHRGRADDHEYDGLMIGIKPKERSSEQEEALRAKRAIAAQHKYDRATEACAYCLESTRLVRRLIVSMGEKTLLLLPERGAMVPGHCLITPMQHALGLTMVDEEVFAEVERFKRCLLRMFASLRAPQTAVFIETVMHLKKQRHTVLECIPLPPEVGLDAPLYFSKAISEAGEEWSQHRKLINTTDKGLRRSVPKNFAYFHVQCGESQSFAHVIEDEVPILLACNH